MQQTASFEGGALERIEVASHLLLRSKILPEGKRVRGNCYLIYKGSVLQFPGFDVCEQKPISNFSRKQLFV